VTPLACHGTNAPDTVGHAVSSGCFRLVNEDLYEWVPVGAKVIVQQWAEAAR
jgi:lipoprotein-anchoring transpeptidase ErfK/SrfK